MREDGRSTLDRSYVKRLIDIESSWLRRTIDVQIPYRWNLLRLEPGYTLDIGCGIGRNLTHLKGHGVGVDHNPEAVRQCKKRGLSAFTVTQFLEEFQNNKPQFDSILISHVLEHLEEPEMIDTIRMYLPFLKMNGKVIMIVPQKAGFLSDSTHKTEIDRAKMQSLIRRSNLQTRRIFSFPFPSVFGKLFRYNEWVGVATKEQ